MPYYLATAPNGHLFYADRAAAVGATLHALVPTLPFPSKDLWVMDSPAHALHTPFASWPCALWEIEVPKEQLQRKRQRHKGCYQVRSLTVVAELDPVDALGVDGQRVLAFVETIKNLRADQLRICTSTVDDYYAAAGDRAHEDKVPVQQAFNRARVLRQKLGRDDVYEILLDQTRKAAERIGNYLWDIEYVGGSHNNPYYKMQFNLTDACFYATSALLVADVLEDEDFVLMTEDFTRITGICLQA
jgi:hypothetical protein